MLQGLPWRPIAAIVGEALKVLSAGFQQKGIRTPLFHSSGCRWHAKIVQVRSETKGVRVRVRTEDRRQAIIDVALGAFREFGFERTSMAVISRRLGGSKGTLYGYFRSKEELFESAMKAAYEGPGDQIMNLLDPKATDLTKVLQRFAKAYLVFAVGPEVLSITRTAIAEGSSSSLGPHLFEHGPGRALAKMTHYFSEVAKAGKLRKGTLPRTAALHFKGLIEAGFLEEALYGADTQSDEATCEAVDAFLRAYIA